MEIPSPHDIPIRSHCIVLSFTTTNPMTSNHAAGRLRQIVRGSDLGVFACMAGPAGGTKNGAQTAFRIAANVASIPDDQLPERLRALKEQFIREACLDQAGH